MSIKIESSIPMPAGRTSYPFASMVEGDSFFIPGEKAAAKVAAAARAFGRKNSVKFSVHSVEEEGVKGARCWRV